MITLKPFLENQPRLVPGQDKAATDGLTVAGGVRQGAALPGAALEAYRDALGQMALAGARACPAEASGLEKSLRGSAQSLKAGSPAAQWMGVQETVRGVLDAWGRQAAEHYRQKAAEVKDLLLAMTRAAETVGERDRKTAEQLTAVSTRLEKVADLDDLTQMRTVIEQSACEMRNSIERMRAEGNATLAEMRAQLRSYETRLEAAEQQAWRDALTGLHNRPWMEARIEQELDACHSFSVAMIDIDSFKGVNDTFGHLAGDDLLRQFARKLGAACGSRGHSCRWGGDEFLVLIVAGQREAEGEVEALRRAVSTGYDLELALGKTRTMVEASFGVAERRQGEDLGSLLARADAAMYAAKNGHAHRWGRGQASPAIGAEHA